VLSLCLNTGLLRRIEAPHIVWGKPDEDHCLLLCLDHLYIGKHQHYRFKFEAYVASEAPIFVVRRVILGTLTGITVTEVGCSCRLLVSFSCDLPCVGNVRREDGSPDPPHMGPVARKGMGWIKLAQGRVNAVMNLGSTKIFFFKKRWMILFLKLPFPQTKLAILPYPKIRVHITSIGLFVYIRYVDVPHRFLNNCYISHERCAFRYGNVGGRCLWPLFFSPLSTQVDLMVPICSVSLSPPHSTQDLKYRLTWCSRYNRHHC